MAASPVPHACARAHVLVVGAGGIGCPAAWALAEAGVRRLTIVDPDAVSLSNLPRQVLYGPQDVGRPKAPVLAERLAGHPAEVVGLAERLDDTNAEARLADADLVLDATDGARTKDWLNALAVRHDVPLVHAAALRSEGRILDVPPGGRPCLACLFGRLEEEQGTCADLGVWGGVVGAVGFLAAATALWRLEHPQAPSRGYLVLDLETGRAVTLSAEPTSGCPVCGRDAKRAPEPYPDPGACRVEVAGGAVQASHALDLVEEECPMNLLRARQAVEALGAGEVLEILIGEEGVASVPDGLRALGHEVLEETPRGAGLRLVVRRGREGAPEGERLTRDRLLRFARQVVLPEVGEEGQRRLLGGRALVAGDGPAEETAAVYLAAAGLGVLEIAAPGPAGAAAGRFPLGASAQGAGRRDEVLAASLGPLAEGAVRVAPSEEGPPVVALAVAGGGSGKPASFALRASGAEGGTRLVRRAAAGAAAERDGAAPQNDLGGAAGRAVQRALGALLADAVCREIVLGRAPELSFALLPSGALEA